MQFSCIIRTIPLTKLRKGLHSTSNSSLLVGVSHSVRSYDVPFPAAHFQSHSYPLAPYMIIPPTPTMSSATPMPAMPYSAYMPGVPTPVWHPGPPFLAMASTPVIPTGMSGSAYFAHYAGILHSLLCTPADTARTYHRLRERT